MVNLRAAVAQSEDTLKELLKEKDYLVGHSTSATATLMTTLVTAKNKLSRKSRFALRDDIKALEVQLSVVQREIRGMFDELKQIKNEALPAQKRVIKQYKMEQEQIETTLQQQKTEYKREMENLNKYMQNIERQSTRTEIRRKRKELQQLQHTQLRRSGACDVITEEQEKELASLQAEVEEYVVCEDIVKHIVDEAWRLIEERQAQTSSSSYTLRLGVKAEDACYKSYLKHSTRALEPLKDTDELLLHDNSADDSDYYQHSGRSSPRANRSPSPRSRRVRDAHGVVMKSGVDREILGYTPIPSTENTDEAFRRDSMLLEGDNPLYISTADERHNEVSDAITDALDTITSSVGRPAIPDPTYPLPPPMGSHGDWTPSSPTPLEQAKAQRSFDRTYTPGLYSQSGRGFEWPATSRGGGQARPQTSHASSSPHRHFGANAPRPPTAPVGSSRTRRKTKTKTTTPKWWHKGSDRHGLMTERPARYPMARRDAKGENESKRERMERELYKKALWKSYTTAKPSKLQFVKDAQDALIEYEKARPMPPKTTKRRGSMYGYTKSNRLFLM